MTLPDSALCAVTAVYHLQVWVCSSSLWTPCSTFYLRIHGLQRLRATEAWCLAPSMQPITEHLGGADVSASCQD